jgi:light-regulated signal transduction histidine kinase (bacteriophytochrome)
MDDRIEVLEINRDITRDVREQEIRELFARALHLKRMSSSKRQTLRRDRFLATMSHELRTPLNAIHRVYWDPSDAVARPVDARSGKAVANRANQRAGTCCR